MCFIRVFITSKVQTLCRCLEVFRAENLELTCLQNSQRNADGRKIVSDGEMSVACFKTITAPHDKLTTKISAEIIVFFLIITIICFRTA